MVALRDHLNNEFPTPAAGTMCTTDDTCTCLSTVIRPATTITGCDIGESVLHEVSVQWQNRVVLVLPFAAACGHSDAKAASAKHSADRELQSSSVADVCYAMDGSGSILQDAWDQETALVRSSVTSIGGDSSNLAVLAFSTNVIPIAGPTTRGQAVAPTSNFTTSIQSATYEGAGTEMGPAIQACQASPAAEVGMCRAKLQPALTSACS